MLPRLLFLALAIAPNLYGAETLVAVASNFIAPAKAIAAAFEAQTSHQAILSVGSTGKLYAQIINGAPFEVFLAADAIRPEKVEAKGLGATQSRFTYALGKIVLLSAKPRSANIDAEIFQNFDNFKKLAIANPKIAPYGAASVDVLKQLGVYQQVKEKLIRGENIAQTYQFVITGNAQFGFVSLSQIKQQTEKSNNKTAYWLVPDNLYSPIQQDAILLNRGKKNEAALAFMAFLKSPTAQKIISSYGYGLE